MSFFAHSDLPIMPFQPPTRPHSANPGGKIFRPPSSASIHHPNSSHQQQQHQRSTSSLSLTIPQGQEADWEDAWDSSSDREDEEGVLAGNDSHRAIAGRGGPSSGTLASTSTRPIAHSRARSNQSVHSGRIGGRSGAEAATAMAIPGAQEEKERQSSSSTTAQSWSSSFQHVTAPIPSPGSRAVQNSVNTYRENAGSPGPGTNMAGAVNKTRLPPGGAWEHVEPAEAQATPEPEEVKIGPEAVRSDIEAIMTDPLQLLSSLSLNSAPATPIGGPSSPHPATPLGYSAIPLGSASTPRTPKSDLGRARSVRTERRRDKFAKVLKGRAEEGSIEQSELKKLAWSGVPAEVRPIVWQLLLNYLPLPSAPRLPTLSRKRREYSQLVTSYFSRGQGGLDQAIWHQIEIDVPRTRPGVPLWACPTTQKALERILYVWAIRHPASGYVQGINDLVCPFFQVFLGAYIDGDPEQFDVGHLPQDALAAIEADTFWCLSKLLDGIQDNYISQQPGIQRLVKRMSELVKRIDAPLAAHFEEQGVEFMQFAFRWMNCLLMREMSVKCTIRMWDTYLAEGTDAFSQFHLYVCSALLVKYSERLREMDFQEMIMFLQRLPTQSWTDHDVELLLSEAFVLKMVWQGAENHFKDMPNGQGGGFGMLGR